MGWRRARNPNQSMFTSRQVHGHELQKPQSSVIRRNSNIHNNTNGILLFIHSKSFLKSKSYPIILGAILHVLDGWWKNSVFTPQCLMHTQVFWRHSLVYLVSLNDFWAHTKKPHLVCLKNGCGLWFLWTSMTIMKAIQENWNAVDNSSLSAVALMSVILCMLNI